MQQQQHLMKEVWSVFETLLLKDGQGSQVFKALSVAHVETLRASLPQVQYVNFRGAKQNIMP
jgi:hypothetical protein